MAPSATSPIRPTWQQLEASLEAYFHARVKRLLNGRAVKLAPIDKGCPDRMVLLPNGTIKLVELKADRGAPSAAQLHWHQRASGMGIPVAIVKGKVGVDAWIAETLREITPGRADKTNRRTKTKETTA